jgi:2-iminobutanoate/2-iminopropanoate deaminase
MAAMSKQIVSTRRAPAAVGPYSQAVRVGEWLYLSGQIGLDPATGQMVPGDVVAQAHRVLQNLQAVVEAAGGSLADVVKVTVYLDNMDNFARVNEVYATYFPDQPPARACVQAARLPRNAAVEMDAVARLG